MGPQGPGGRKGGSRSAWAVPREWGIGGMEQPTILLANPRDCERKLLAHLLEHEGFRVHEAANGVDTVRDAQTKRVDVVLLEVGLWQTGEMNALTSLKLHPRTRCIPVVLYGEPRHPEDVVNGRKAGATEWIVRDGSVVEKLLNALRTILEHPAPERPPAEANDRPAEPRTTPETSHLTAARVAEAVDGVEQLRAYEFTVMDAITTTHTRERAEDHILEIAMRDPMLLLALFGEARNRAACGKQIVTTDPGQAARQVGPKGFYVIAESVVPVKEGCDQGWHPGPFWVHSVGTARIAELLARRLELGNPTEAAAAGLLHAVGYYVLAQHFRPLYTRLAKAASTGARPGNAGERCLIGTHGGQIACWVLQKFGLPELYGDVVISLHEPAMDRQALTVNARILSLVVRAAQQLAHALFPGDTPLGVLDPMSHEFAAALRHADSSANELITEARRIIAELTTEMVHLFPLATQCCSLYRRKPLDRLVYFCPTHEDCDLVRIYFESRSSHVELLTRPNGMIRSPSTTPMVLNLTPMESLQDQVKTLSSFMTAGLLRGRRGVILLPAGADPLHEQFASEEWRLVPLPTHPAAWFPGLVGLPKAAFAAQLSAVPAA